MIPTDKLEYLNLLITSMNIKGETKEEKIFLAITDALNEMSDTLQCYDEALNGMTGVLADIEESVIELEEEVFGDSDDDAEMSGLGEFGEFNDFEDDIYDICCANCNKTITVDYDALNNGSVKCPGCRELIEFSIEFE